MTAFDAWLDARDAAALSTAWSALAPRTIELGRPGWVLTGAAAAQLASTFLGLELSRVAWLAEPHDFDRAPPASYQARRSVAHSFLEHAVDAREDCLETWDLREVRAGKRGVQCVNVGFHVDDGTPDGRGGGGTVVRVFDREKKIGASVWLHSRTVSVIGDIDVRGPLDLFDFSVGFRVPAWTAYDLAHARTLLAQLAGEIDPPYVQSAGWPGRELRRNEATDHYGEPSVAAMLRFEHGAHAVVANEQRTGGEGSTSLVLDGLPWGHALSAAISFEPEGASGHLDVRLPEALGDRVLARLRSIAGLELP